MTKEQLMEAQRLYREKMKLEQMLSEAKWEIQLLKRQLREVKSEPHRNVLPLR